MLSHLNCGILSCIFKFVEWIQNRNTVATGLRIVALCRGKGLEALTYTGVCGVCDPPREGVRDAVATLARASVDVKMVTGDARPTALAVGTYTPHTMKLCTQFSRQPLAVRYWT